MKSLFGVLVFCMSSFLGGVCFPAVSDESQSYSDMIGDIVELWDRYDVVAFAEHHGVRNGAEVRKAVVRRPKFANKVDIILIEAGNSYYQPMLDRYIEGEDVPYEELAWLWRATGTRAWNSPIYFEFLQTVREANQGLPAGDRIRVLAGDLPINLDSMTSARDLLEYADRGDFPTHIADCRLLREGKKGMIVYGGNHVYHNSGMSFITSLDKLYPGRIATVEAVYGRSPGVERLRKVLGLDNSVKMIPVAGSAVAGWNLHETRKGRIDPRNSLTIGEALDYLLYLGREEAIAAPPDESQYDEPAYRAWWNRYFQLRRARARLIDGGEEYREWGEYSCDA